MTLRDELEPFACTGREASQIVNDLFDDIIAAPRRDPRLARIPLGEFDLRLADVRTEFERRLFKEMRDRVHLDDVDTYDGVEP